MNEFSRVLMLLALIKTPSISQVRQEQGTVAFSYTISSVGLHEEYQLKFDRDGSVYSHHQKERKFISPQGYEIISPKKYYDWYLNSRTKTVTYQKKVESGEFIFSKYRPEPILWEITNETKVLLGYTVQKAIAQKHHLLTGLSTTPVGEAIAWFAVDLPIPSGPERFWGLPGLILELTFTNSNQKYLAEKITFEPVGNIKPNQGIEVSKDQLEDPSKINKKWLKNARELLNNDND